HQCGFDKIVRIERGIAYSIDARGLEGNGALPALLHDRMTEAVMTLADVEQLFRHVPPRAMTQVDVLGGGRAALVAVLASFAFPTTLVLDAPAATGNPPGGILLVLKNLLLSAVSNPVKALMEANFIGILAWAIGLGIALRHAGDGTRKVLNDLADAVSKIVHVVIRFAP
ncbi:MAG: cation:dicarboxylate symporter family transporter, partial [Gammaproteobacteria bacterium]